MDLLSASCGARRDHLADRKSVLRYVASCEPKIRSMPASGNALGTYSGAAHKCRNLFLKSPSPSYCSRDGRSQFDSVVTEKPNADGDRAGIDVRNVDFCLTRNQPQDLIRRGAGRLRTIAIIDKISPKPKALQPGNRTSGLHPPPDTPIWKEFRPQACQPPTHRNDLIGHANQRAAGLPEEFLRA